MNGDMQIINQLYDFVRMVDPVQKKVIVTHQTENCTDVASHCFGFWETGSMCENCISSRALNERQVITKLEYNSERIFMVTAMPMVEDGNTIVLEMLKDITENTVVDIRPAELGKLHRIIDRGNKAVVWDTASNTYNSNYIYERLPYDIYITADENTELSLLTARLDNFEEIENTYGKAVADGVIKEFARILKRYCRPGKVWLARYGSADFILVLPHAGEAQANRQCWQLKKALRKSNLHLEGYEIKVAASFGFHTISKGIPVQDLLNQSQQNLIAKQTLSGDLAKQWRDKFISHYSFSPREEEVLRLMLEGLGNQEIAQKLFISLSTVKKHISSIYYKSGVQSRAELLANYHQEFYAHTKIV